MARAGPRATRAPVTTNAAPASATPASAPTNPRSARRPADICSTNAECCGGLCTKPGTATVGTCALPSRPAARTAPSPVRSAEPAPMPDRAMAACLRAAEIAAVGRARPTRPAESTSVRLRAVAGRPASSARRTRTAAASPRIRRQDEQLRALQQREPVGSRRTLRQRRLLPRSGRDLQARFDLLQRREQLLRRQRQHGLHRLPADIVGIPRCTAAGDCSDAGTRRPVRSARAAPIAAGSPAFPPTSPTAARPFVCDATCVPRAGSCTTTADCCVGLPCVIPSGSTSGSCGGGGTTSDGGTTPSTDAGTTTCAQYGQTCSGAGSCCNGVPCNGGRCLYPQ